MKEVFMALAVFAIVGGGIAFGLRYREEKKAAADVRPSIANFAPENLPEKVSEVSKEDAKENEPKKEEGAAPAKPDAPATIVVKVLNGGAAGGSAGKVTTYLKTNGYTKAEAGNANSTSKGMVIYYSADMVDEAKALQLLLLKQYKGVESKLATEAKITEAKTVPIVVVLGT